MLWTSMDEIRPHQPDPPADELDPFEPEDPRTAARLDAEAAADEAAGELIPHDRMAQWLLALARGEHPPAPKTDAELARERDEHSR